MIQGTDEPANAFVFLYEPAGGRDLALRARSVHVGLVYVVRNGAVFAVRVAEPASMSR